MTGVGRNDKNPWNSAKGRYTAGLLNGRRVVTHWMRCGLLSSSYPDIRVEPDTIYVRDGAIWSSAGVTGRFTAA